MSETIITPMAMTEVDELTCADDSIYELKFDGYRMVAYVEDDEATLRSKRGTDFTGRGLAIAQTLPQLLGGHSAVLDGELIALNDDNEIDYDLLRRKGPRLAFVAFDLLRLGNQVLFDEPLMERKRRLGELSLSGGLVQTIAHFESDAFDALHHIAEAHNHEGVLRKKQDSPYRPGTRSKAWHKQINIRHRSWVHASPTTIHS